MTLDEYSEQMLQETLASAEIDGVPRLEAFTQLVMERLSAAGEFDEGQVAYHRKTGLEVSGWAHDPERGALHLMVTDWTGTCPSPSLTANGMDSKVTRLVRFVNKCALDYAASIEESDPVWELADFIARERSALLEIRLYLLSDGTARRATTPSIDSQLLDVSTSLHIWDLERLYRLDTSGLEREPIRVRILDFQSSPLPVLEGPEEDGHRVYLAIIPATLLADLYSTFGSRLLERNVRAFLQARGTVNKGMRDTILNEPDRFLAYNNGISATAASVRMERIVGSGLGISEIEDFQIVNGGQTTASLHQAAMKDREALNSVAVQAKLTVVESDCIDEMVPFISKYSNTQNKVTGADFSANHPFHIKVEELSRTIWAPAPDGSQRQTRWFYERARGQYAVELTRAGTPARQRQFKLSSPATQKLTKTELAKYVHTWAELPHLVALGAEKNFREFMLRLDEDRIVASVDWFQRLVALAILFRTSEKLVQRQGFGGYRAQIVTYSLSKLAHSTQQRLDLREIWRRQQISEAVCEAITELSHPIHQIIANPTGRVRNSGEWTKKLDCWKAVEEVKWSIPSRLNSELIAVSRGSVPSVSTLSPEPTEKDLNEVAEAQAISADTWFAIAHWARVTDNLQPWQRSLAFSIGKRVGSGEDVTIKQAVQGKRLFSEALRLGFQPEEASLPKA
jgi:hypothetical protein